MSDLTERQRLILALIIRDFIDTAQPVSSKRLVDHFRLKVSTATIRNDMVTLTELGYLRQPHTSAGRVPTEEGYRFFVHQLMVQTDLPTDTKRTIIHQFYQAGHDVEKWMRLAASILAHQAQAASVVTAPRSGHNVFKHLELINTYGRQVLMVLVLESGEVSQQMLALAEPVPQAQLTLVAQRLNQIFFGLSARQIKNIAIPLEAIEYDVARLIVDDIQRLDTITTGEVYRDGITHVLSEPEFGDSEMAINALRVLEERPLLEDLLSRTVLASETGGIQVLIGGEGTWEELRDCSVILARYGKPGFATGTLGILGPIRMPYGKSISTVRFVAGILSDLVTDIHGE